MKDISSLVSGIRKKAEKLVAKQAILIEGNEKISNEIEKIREELTEKKYY